MPKREKVGGSFGFSRVTLITDFLNVCRHITPRQPEAIYTAITTPSYNDINGTDHGGVVGRKTYPVLKKHVDSYSEQHGSQKSKAFTKK